MKRWRAFWEAQGELEQALAVHPKPAISEKLAASDQKNRDWQRDLSVSFNRMAGILEAQGERERTLAQYTQSPTTIIESWPRATRRTATGSATCRKAMKRWRVFWMRRASVARWLCTPKPGDPSWPQATEERTVAN